MRDQEILGLQEAYSSIYAQQEEVEQLEEEPKGLPYGPVGKGFKRLPAGPKREKMMKNAKKYTRAAMADADREGEAVGDNRNKMGRINDALTNPRLREETDLFDYILEHLVAEGYADTNKAALAIMANMSEEWKQSIVEANLNLNAPGGRSGWGRTTSGTAQGDFEAGGGLTKMQKSGMSRDDVIIQGQKNIRNSPLGRSNTGRGVYAKDRSTEVGRKQNDIYGKAGVKFPEDSK
jgi:hypothetical protein